VSAGEPLSLSRALSLSLSLSSSPLRALASLQEHCSKGAMAGGTEFCKAHGGGRRCYIDGCSKR
jgi:hypothetical protein